MKKLSPVPSLIAFIQYDSSKSSKEMVMMGLGFIPRLRWRRMKPEEKKAAALGSFLLSAALLFLISPRLCFDYRPPALVKKVGVDGGVPMKWAKGVQQQQQRGLKGGGEREIKEEEGDAECDLFDGKWVWDESYPLYESEDCAFLDGGFRCSENGRPDRLYTHWRWQPHRCNLSRFDAKDMLQRLRNKHLVFVGDSIGRNQWESLLCMLSSAISDKSSIYEVNGNSISKHKGFLAFKFRDYNSTVGYYRAPFLIRHSHAPPRVPKEVATTLKLDVLDYTAQQWKDADVLIFNTGHWWTPEKTVKRGHYFQEGKNVRMEMSVGDAYQRSIKTLLEWIHKEVNLSKTQVFFRTYAPVHFRFGDWKTGGSCHLETLPQLNTSLVELSSWSHLLSPFQNISDKQPTEVPIRELEVLNITHMTAQRKDGHLSLYYLGPNGTAPLHRQDCSHWCLPGVPDAWNEILYTLFLRREYAAHQKITAAAPVQSFSEN